MIPINDLGAGAPPPENPTHRRLMVLADRVEAGEHPIAEIEAELTRLEAFFHDLPESPVHIPEGDLFRQALEDYHQAALCLDQGRTDQARELCVRASDKIRSSKESIEDAWETPLELES